MGTGLHGTNSLPVGICTQLYEIYILPRALYGTEAIVLPTDDVSKLEKFQRYTLRCILGLPERTAIAGIYILTGALPMEQQHKIRTLCFLHALLQEETTRAVVICQYIMKDNKSASWVVQAERMLRKHNLPTIKELFMALPPKPVWKRIVKTAAHDYASNKLQEEAGTKSTLRYLAPYHIPRTAQYCLSNAYNPYQVTRANIKSRLLLDVNPL